MGHSIKVSGSLSVAVLFAALSALSACGNADGGGAGGTAGTTKGGAAGNGNSGGTNSSSGGSLGNSSGGSLNSGTGGTGGVDLSSDPGSGSCTNFTPCGGDVLGTWRVESLCLDSFATPFPNCPEAKASLTLTGSLTFNSDGTYIPSGTTVSRTTLPASCSALCAGTGCTTSADGGCVCEATTPVNETPLQYSVSGNKLIVMPKTSVTQTAYYCRNGNQILMRGYSTAATRYQYDLRR